MADTEKYELRDLTSEEQLTARDPDAWKVVQVFSCTQSECGPDYCPGGLNCRAGNAEGEGE